MREHNLEGEPEKYFTVPDGQPFDSDTYETIMDRIEFLNKCSEDLADGCEISFGNEYTISFFSHMISTYLYQAKALMEAGEK